MSAWVGLDVAATVVERPSVGGSTSQGAKLPGRVAVDISSATIDLRLADGETERSGASGVSEAALFAASPWRTFRWYKGQSHCSGTIGPPLKPSMYL